MGAWQLKSICAFVVLSAITNIPSESIMRQDFNPGLTEVTSLSLNGYETAKILLKRTDAKILIAGHNQEKAQSAAAN
jgi:hypothetical protein